MAASNPPLELTLNTGMAPQGFLFIPPTSGRVVSVAVCAIRFRGLTPVYHRHSISVGPRRRVEPSSRCLPATLRWGSRCPRPVIASATLMSTESNPHLIQSTPMSTGSKPHPIQSLVQNVRATRPKTIPRTGPSNVRRGLSREDVNSLVCLSIAFPIDLDSSATEPESVDGELDGRMEDREPPRNAIKDHPVNGPVNRQAGTKPGGGSGLGLTGTPQYHVDDRITY
ncbi:hypothetical protein EDB89DRAFT_413493 [Lactarius sanguifluus]|nr:hypothetical protein EDB89DRAFT_413493 [Lactarius sanguifluus]